MLAAQHSGRHGYNSTPTVCLGMTQITITASFNLVFGGGFDRPFDTGTPTRGAAPWKCGDLRYRILIKDRPTVAAETSSTSTDSFQILNYGTESPTYCGCAAVVMDN